MEALYGFKSQPRGHAKAPFLNMDYITELALSGDALTPFTTMDSI